MHLKLESEKRVKNVDFHTAKNVQKQATLILYFWTNSYIDPEATSCSLATVSECRRRETDFGVTNVSCLIGI